LVAKYGPDDPGNAVFLSRLGGNGVREVMAADIFWDTGQVPDLQLLPEVTKIYVNEDGEAPGTAVTEDIPRGRWSSGRKHVTVRCEQPEALRWMLSLLPRGESCEIETEQQGLLPDIERLARVRGAEERLYYTVDRESFKPSDHAKVTWLGEGEEGAVDRFSDRESRDGGLARYYYALQAVGLPFKTAAVVDSGRIVSFCCVGSKTEQVWSTKWICTAADRRRCGNGRQVLSAGTAEILAMGKTPIYSLRERNLASRRLCESVGYQLVSITTRVVVSL